MLRAPTKWAVVFAEKRGCRAGATAGPARAAFRQNEMAVDLKDVDLKKAARFRAQLNSR